MLRQKGIASFAKESAFRLYDAYHETRLGISTEGLIDKPELGHTDPDCVEYTPLGYKPIKDTLRRLNLDWRKCSFLDYGCGKGRAISYAATLPFQRVIGVELSERLAQDATRNLKLLKKRGARSVEVHCTDAVNFKVPPDVNVIYFYNPFRGAILRRVLQNIMSSVRESPRRIHIVFFNRNAFEEIAAGFRGITRLGYGRVHPNIGCGIYMIYPDAR
jgi:SAM-dependent methyltransferase